MTQGLEYFRALLRLDIATTCGHLRNKEYPNPSEQLQTALTNMIYYQLLEDELGRILNNYSLVVDAMGKFLKGEVFDEFPEGDEPEDIYTYCLYYFEKADCRLGTATPELEIWVSTYADQKKTIREGFDKFFPNVTFVKETQNEEGQSQPVPLSDAELFDIKTNSYLRDIETSNVLSDFNYQLLLVRGMLNAREPIADILAILKPNPPQ